jgi:two-component system, OmpR family, sensor kinase
VKTPPGRLALRIYIVSLAQLFTVVGAVILVAYTTFQSRPRPDFRKHAQAVTNAVGPHLQNPAALRRAVKRAHSKLRVNLTVYGGDDRVLATNATPNLPPLSAQERSRFAEQRWIFAPGPPPRISMALDGYDKAGAYLVYIPRFPPPPLDLIVWALGIAFVATAIASVLLGRSFAQPLQRLSATARSFGAGDLTARANLKRRDEFGQLSDSFDEMAGRVSLLVRSQQELLANVSHELRTPLARIRVALDLAAEGDAAEAREALAEIAEDMAELERLVGDVLQNARLDLATGRAGSQPPLRPASVDVGALLDKAAARFRATYPQRVLELRLQTPLPELIADAVMLRRAIDNLLDNARKYSDAERPISVAARAIDGSIEILVEDRGIGIAVADLQSVATPFFRTDRSRARRSGGLGLGLSLARRIVEAHGGQLTVESQLGAGTRIRITLPAQEQALAALEPGASQAAEPREPA